MIHLNTLRAFLRYSEWANGQLVHASAGLEDGQLDQSFDIGRGTLRKTLLHIHAGEHIWLQRWQERTETPWPDEDEKASVATIAGRFSTSYAERATFLATLTDGDLERLIAYRDSAGSVFKATLADMVVQGILHSTHHRAQAVNMIRRAGGPGVELDYMMWVRKPA